MSALKAALGDYLGLRRDLGHKLDEHERQLTRFVARLDYAGAAFVAMADALDFRLYPDLDPASSTPAKRLMAAPGLSPAGPAAGSLTCSPTRTWPRWCAPRGPRRRSPSGLRRWPP